jgi:hypothetical protein
MNGHCRRLFTISLALVAPLFPGLASAAGVSAVFDLSSPSRGPFPSDRFTLPDPSHLTGLRVNLPEPDCAVRVSDCRDIDVLNTLDGFNLQPRLSIPFSGPIDVASVSGDTVFVVSLGDARGGGGGGVVGINQIVWDPATFTLHAETEELLDQHTSYLLIVTDGVRDAAGDPVEVGDFARFRRDLNFGQTNDPVLKDYRKALLDALAQAGVAEHHIVSASVFTTQSATAVLEKIRDRIKAHTPGPAVPLASFPLANLTAIQWTRQVGANPANPASFISSFLPLPALSLFPGSIGAVAFGKFPSADWETVARFIPPIGTRTGVPVVQSVNDIHYNLFLPSGSPPPAGWPVAIFGHGFTDSKQGAPFAVASSFAFHGIATIAINVVGHGRGAAGTLTITPAIGPPETVSDGGRGIDQDGNGTIDSTEGVNAAPPRGIIGSRDGLRQTVADLMQLVRVIETGGIPGLDGARIYYAGQSFGGIYGVKFLAVEPSLRAGVLNVPGGAIIEIARLSPAFRALVGISLATRIPPLLNAGPLAPPAWGFNESIPLRDLPPVINAVPGAMEIQTVIDNTEWVSQSGSPVAYAPHLRKSPLAGVDGPPVIIQFAKGDQTVPNPTATAIFRAGDLADRSAYFRNDLVRAAIPGAPANPHTFLTSIASPPLPGAVAALAIGAQQQIAAFFESNGALILDPDGAGAFFEVPIAGALPEELNF